MKRVIICMVLAVMVMASGVFADEYSFEKKVIKVDQKKEYLEITIINKDIKNPTVYLLCS